jgi:hypothetical protein
MQYTYNEILNILNNTDLHWKILKFLILMCFHYVYKNIKYKYNIIKILKSLYFTGTDARQFDKTLDSVQTIWQDCVPIKLY